MEAYKNALIDGDMTWLPTIADTGPAIALRDGLKWRRTCIGLLDGVRHRRKTFDVPTSDPKETALVKPVGLLGFWESPA